MTTRIILSFLLISFTWMPMASAKIEGIDYVTINVSGKNYEVPVGNQTRQKEIYILKRALDGDKEAREVFLNGQKERKYFIGSEKPAWLKVTPDSQEVLS